MSNIGVQFLFKTIAVKTHNRSKDLGHNTKYFQSLSVTCDRSVVLSGYSVSSTNKTDHHDITEMLLKVALNSINQTKPI